MLLIEFVAGTALLQERDRPSQLPIYRNGPAGTFVRFADGLRVSLPTDQVVSAADASGGVRVEFGGMTFSGETEGRLVFHRVRELRPEAELSPGRSHTMFLEPRWISAVYEHGRRVWPALVV